MTSIFYCSVEPNVFESGDAQAGFWGQQVVSPAVGLLTLLKPGGTRGELLLL